MSGSEASAGPLRRTTGPPVLALTRIRFRCSVDAFRAWLKFRSLYRQVGHGSGFLRGSIALADMHTLVNVSIWRSRWDMLMWSGSDRHVRTVRWTYQRVAEVWSGDAQLWHVSDSAREWWGRLDLESLASPAIADEALGLVGESAAKR